MNTLTIIILVITCLSIASIIIKALISISEIRNLKKNNSKITIETNSGKRFELNRDSIKTIDLIKSVDDFLQLQ